MNSELKATTTAPSYSPSIIFVSRKGSGAFKPVQSRSSGLASLDSLTPIDFMQDDGKTVASVLFSKKGGAGQVCIAAKQEDQIFELSLKELREAILSQQCPKTKAEKTSTETKQETNNAESTLLKTLELRPLSNRNQPKGRQITLPSSLYLLPRTESSPKEEKKIGLLTIQERLKKITYYKMKLQRWRKAHPVSRKFKGRERIAFVKYRINGKFAKKTQ